MAARETRNTTTLSTIKEENLFVCWVVRVNDLQSAYYIKSFFQAGETNRPCCSAIGKKNSTSLVFLFIQRKLQIEKKAQTGKVNDANNLLRNIISVLAPLALLSSNLKK